MSTMATLYVRNVPASVYADIQRWAAESARSVNALVLELLEQEVARRDQRAEFHRRLEALKKYPPIHGAEKLIREDRDRGHKPEFGY
jgi:hypothetical protein